MMVARYTGGVLSLFAFGLAVVFGMVAGNPPEIVLSRALWALVVFCVIGLAVGAAAQMVLGEYETEKSAALMPSEGMSAEGEVMAKTGEDEIPEADVVDLSEAADL